MSERLHDPDAAGTCIPTETAGNTLLGIGDIFVADLRGNLSPGDGVGRTHGLAEMTIPALATGKTAVGLALHVDAALDVRKIMLGGQ